MPATTRAVWRLKFVIIQQAVGEDGVLVDPEAEDVKEALSWIKSWKMKPTDRRILGNGLGPEVAWGHLQGDEQAGKNGGPWNPCANAASGSSNGKLYKRGAGRKAQGC
jgi:hypothetical protein